MAVYKVPQDVEADDKLIGPFSFRQFIYLIIVAASIAIGWVLSQIFIPLAIIPLPIILLFGALALPLRKDQPMETYLAALISFYIKPHKRIWDPDGLQELIEITAPRVVETHLTKDISQNEAERRFSYLADIVDSRGWAVRGVSEQPQTVNSMSADMYYEAQQVEDILDESTREYHQIDSQLDQAATARKQALMNQMRQQSAASQPQPAVEPQAPEPAPAQVATPEPTLAPNPPVNPTSPAPQTAMPEPHLVMSPYPTSMHQSVVQPLSTTSLPVQDQVSDDQQNTSGTTPSPDIINLANNSDLSVETIAHEANRIKERESLPEDEVIVSLR